MKTHVDVLGCLYIVTGIAELSLIGLASLIMLALVPLANIGDVLGGTVLAVAAFFVGAVALVLSVPKIVAGIGLLQRRPWARILAAVLAFLSFFNFPLGTIVSIYALWVLLSPGTDQVMVAAA